VTKTANIPRLSLLVGEDKLHVVATAGGKILYTNYPLTASIAAQRPQSPDRLDIKAVSQLLRPDKDREVCASVYTNCELPSRDEMKSAGALRNSSREKL
jgi:hypothetical protein